MSKDSGIPPQRKKRKLDTNSGMNGHNTVFIRQYNDMLNNGNYKCFHNFLGLQNMECLTNNIMTFLFEKFVHENVEIEFKIGKYLKKNNNNNSETKNDDERICHTYGLETPTIISNKNNNFKFDSRITHDIFVKLNKMFNGWTNNAKKHRGNIIEGKDNNCNKLGSNDQKWEYYNIFPDIKYSRTQDIDKLYENPYKKQSNIRVTLDINKPNSIKSNGILEKSRIGDKAVVFPEEKFDVRLSCSTENIAPKPVGQIVQLIRVKDRISYKFDIFSIDLSVVHTYETDLSPNFIERLRLEFTKKPNQRKWPMDHGYKKTYEIEVEIIDNKWLLKQRNLRRDKKPSQFKEACCALVQLMLKLNRIITIDITPQQCKPQKPIQQRNHNGNHGRMR